MIKYIFLLESKNQLVKAINRSKNVRGIMGRGLKYTVDEYAKKMYDGQILRLKKIADKNGLKVKILPPEPGGRLACSGIHGDTIVVHIPFEPIKNNPIYCDSLNLADSLAHEVDEISLMISAAKKYKKSYDAISYATSKQTIPYTMSGQSMHNIGVLAREVKRGKKLKALYDFELIKRIPQEYEANRKPNEFYMNALRKF